MTPVCAGPSHAVLRDEPVESGPANVAAPASKTDEVRMGMQVVEALLHPEFPAPNIFHRLASLIGRWSGKPALSGLVEMLLCKLAIKLIALRTVSFGEGEVMRLHLVFL